MLPVEKFYSFSDELAGKSDLGGEKLGLETLVVRERRHTLARLLTYSCLCCFLYNLLPVRITRWNWGWHPTCFLDILCKSAFSLFTINLSHLIRLIEDGFPNPLTLRFSDISLSPFFFFLPLLHFLYVTLVNLESDMEK